MRGPAMRRAVRRRATDCRPIGHGPAACGTAACGTAGRGPAGLKPARRRAVRRGPARHGFADRTPGGRRAARRRSPRRWTAGWLRRLSFAGAPAGHRPAGAEAGDRGAVGHEVVGRGSAAGGGVVLRRGRFRTAAQAAFGRCSGAGRRDSGARDGRGRGRLVRDAQGVRRRGEAVVEGVGRGRGPRVPRGVVVQLPPPVVLLTGGLLPLLAHAPNCPPRRPDENGASGKTGHGVGHRTAIRNRRAIPPPTGEPPGGAGVTRGPRRTPYARVTV